MWHLVLHTHGISPILFLLYPPRAGNESDRKGKKLSFMHEKKLYRGQYRKECSKSIQKLMQIRSTTLLSQSDNFTESNSEQKNILHFGGTNTIFTDCIQGMKWLGKAK